MVDVPVQSPTIKESRQALLSSGAASCGRPSCYPSPDSSRAVREDQSQTTICRGYLSEADTHLRLFTKVLLPSVTEEWLPTSGAQDGEGNGLARILVPRNLRISMLPYPVRGKQKSYSLLRGEAGDGPPLAVCRYTS